MDVLSTREWAVIIWSLVIFSACMLSAELRHSFRDVWRSFRQRRILQILLVTYAFFTLVIIVSARIGIWDTSLLKDTVVWCLIAGFAIPIAALSASKQDQFVRRHLAQIVGLATVLSFLLSTFTFDLWVELVLQPVVAFLVILGFAAEREKGTERLVRPIAALLMIIYLGMVAGAIWGFYRSWRELDAGETLSAFALTIWLPLVATPYLLVLAAAMSYGALFSRLKLRTHGRFDWRVRLGIVLSLRLRARLIADLQKDGQYRYEVLEQGSVAGVWRTAETFKREHRRRREDQRHKEAELVRLAGAKGAAEDGIVLDKRELKETRRVLEWIRTCHDGQYGKNNRFRRDLLENVLTTFEDKGLTSPHGIEMVVSKDGQAWYAWRELPSGLFLGVGGVEGPPSGFVYEGWSAPMGFPSAAAEGWASFLDQTPKHWAYN